MDWQRIAEHLVARQKELGMTGAALADKAGTSTKTVSDLRHAKRANHSAEMLARISTALGWPPDTLRRIGEGEDPPPTTDERVARLEEAFARLVERDEQRGRRLEEIMEQIRRLGI
jgi:transcriptional regulator with XRE-family HTH domain